MLFNIDTFARTRLCKTKYAEYRICHVRTDMIPHYVFVVSPDAASIILDYLPEAAYAHLGHQFISEAWMEQCRSSGMSPSHLGHVTIEEVQDDFTFGMIEDILKYDRTLQLQSQSVLRYGCTVIRTYTPSDDNFYALLGTFEGSQVSSLLSRNARLFALSNPPRVKNIRSIQLAKNALTNAQYAKWVMVFTLGDFAPPDEEEIAYARLVDVEYKNSDIYKEGKLGEVTANSGENEVQGGTYAPDPEGSPAQAMPFYRNSDDIPVVEENFVQQCIQSISDWMPNPEDEGPQNRTQ